MITINNKSYKKHLKGGFNKGRSRHEVVDSKRKTTFRHQTRVQLQRTKRAYNS